MQNNIPETCVKCGQINTGNCRFCVRDGQFAQKNYQDYKTLYDKKDKDNFSFAIRLYKDISYYVNKKEIKLNDYLNQLHKARRRRNEAYWGKKYLWKMYRTIEFFPDLCDIKARNLPFSIYNEIVHASLPESAKHDIRKSAEERSRHLPRVREDIIEKQIGYRPQTKSDKSDCSSIDQVEAIAGLIASKLGFENGKHYKVRITVRIVRNVNKKKQEGDKDEDTKS